MKGKKSAPSAKAGSAIFHFKCSTPSNLFHNTAQKRARSSHGEASYIKSRRLSAHTRREDACDG
jgi:hypothetical protein